MGLTTLRVLEIRGTGRFPSPTEHVSVRGEVVGEFLRILESKTTKARRKKTLRSGADAPRSHAASQSA